MLSDREIKKYLSRGAITIEPFDERQLGTNSYDCRLGNWFYFPTMEGGFVNFTSEEETKQFWGNPTYVEDEVAIPPLTTVLAHTEEVIGGSYGVTTSMRTRSSLGRSGIATCKCLPADTEVRLASGQSVLISQLIVGQSLIGADRNGKTRPAVVKSVREAPVKPTVTIRTVKGRTLTCSTDHLLRVSTSAGVRTMRATDVQKGLYLPVLSQWTPELPVDNVFISVDEARLLGYFVAEGHWSKYRVTFAKVASKEQQRREIVELMAKAFSTAPNPKCSDECIDYNSVEFAQLFKRRFPEICCLAPSKRIPPSLFYSTDDAVRAFLSSYLICDGYDRIDTKSEVQTVSRSLGLMQDIALLAARFGSVPTFKDRKAGAASNMHTYGLYYGREAENLVDRIELSPVQRNVTLDILLSDIKYRHKITRKQLANYAITDKKRISRERLSMIYDLTKDERLNPYLSDLFWDEICEVKDGLAQPGFIDISLDVPTEDDSLFCLSNGLMVLNCAGSGDVGYINRWTMEITNSHPKHTVILPIGLRVCQITFDLVGDTDKLYQGKYGSGKWQPSDMLPKLYNDWDKELWGAVGILNAPRFCYPLNEHRRGKSCGGSGWAYVDDSSSGECSYWQCRGCGKFEKEEIAQ